MFFNIAGPGEMLLGHLKGGVYEALSKRVTRFVETILQQKLRPELAAVHPDKPFTYSEKGYLMPRDLALKFWVDQWLHLAMNDGTFGKIINAWLK